MFINEGTFAMGKLICYFRVSQMLKFIPIKMHENHSSKILYHTSYLIYYYLLDIGNKILKSQF